MYRKASSLAELDPVPLHTRGSLTLPSPLDWAAHGWQRGGGRWQMRGVQIDAGHTFHNRFLLVWHPRPGCFREVSYRDFWRDFAREVCNRGPCVDDTLHVLGARRGAAAEFWVIGGDGRLATHCANGLLYAGSRFGQRYATQRATFLCGKRVRTVDVAPDRVEVNLGAPRPLPPLTSCPAGLLRAPRIVDTGEPHAVTFAEDLADPRAQFEDDAFIELGQAVCRSAAPAGINWNLVTNAHDGLHIRTFERGVRRPTTSCGTGSAAAFYASGVAQGAGNESLKILSAGGEHGARQQGGDILLSGRPTHEQCWRLDEFLRVA